MGSATFDFLADSFLLDSGEIASAYGTRSDDQVAEELDAYRRHVVASADSLEAEILATPEDTRVFLAQERATNEQLTRLAIYAGCAIVNDELYEASYRQDADREAITKYQGALGPSFDRKRVCEAARRAADLTPLVACNYLKYFPYSDFGRPSGPIPLLSPVPPDLPKELREHFDSHVMTNSLVENENGRLAVHPLTPGWPMVAVGFDDERPTKTIRQYFTMTAAGPREGDKIPVVFKKADRVPESIFESWVSQSIDVAIGESIEAALRDYAVSRALRAGLVTQSGFYHKLQSILAGGNAGYDPATMLYSFDAPVLSSLSPAGVAEVRERYEKQRDLFAHWFSRTFSALRNEPDRAKAEAIFKEGVRSMFEDEAELAAAKLSATALTVGTSAGVAIASIGVALGVGTPFGWALSGIAGLGAIFTAAANRRAEPNVFLVRLKKTIE